MSMDWKANIVAGYYVQQKWLQWVAYSTCLLKDKRAWSISSAADSIWGDKYFGVDWAFGVFLLSLIKARWNHHTTAVYFVITVGEMNWLVHIVTVCDKYTVDLTIDHSFSQAKKFTLLVLGSENNIHNAMPVSIGILFELLLSLGKMWKELQLCFL